MGSNLVSLEAKPSGFHSQIQVSEEIALLPLLNGTVHYHYMHKDNLLQYCQRKVIQPWLKGIFQEREIRG
jgi:hypothetical protein